MASIVTLGGGASVVHLTYREGEEWRIACMVHITDFSMQPHQPNYLRSNDTRAVNCPQCKMTNVFKKVRETEH